MHQSDGCTVTCIRSQDEVLHWVRGKTEETTGIELAIPIHPELRAIIDATPSGHLNFLVTELAEAGCTPHEIAAITGHASLKEIVRYTKTADRKRLAASAMEKVKAGTSIVKPVARFDKKRKKS